MSRTFVLVGTTLAIAASPLLLAQPVSAGASASAPSKYSQSHQVVVAHQVLHPVKTDYPITEYSSSSAKKMSPRK
ncbi:MAG: hypothetical protein E6614_08775 [Bradyrhizobium sp.]|jgi:hypothetical protein|uniref:Uncharacterized protein n=1 Tax=Bradyrhizobium denitrificans TaxID=2734912 RepID=A0ABS5G570_9BRAD|nr:MULTISPECIES: hypothetical protein [Bradyrhizobium]MBR1136458.1 hypothetical protein [Bradyrhizobium denitrificans]MCL8488009.1 hypothetical protein [Bradyrhizobium denitrificans]MDH6261055.1 hypothetical protein [Bradyrhizobium sp. BR13661]MDU0958691.1 hypothetical protein [Bradyrhizobium sp.]MDU1496916.1 hypothetical protein [Bradyrhizobium sp.]